MISMDKKYKYRNGEPARILCVDSGDEEYPVISLNSSGEVLFHSTSGRMTQLAEFEWDLIELSKYADFKDNEEVVCWNLDERGKYKRHFAYENNGKAFCYSDGMSTWTASQNETTSWDMCVKASEFDGEL